jgi:hypothetical protein
VKFGKQARLCSLKVFPSGEPLKVFPSGEPLKVFPSGERGGEPLLVFVCEWHSYFLIVPSGARERLIVRARSFAKSSIFVTAAQ